MHTIKESDNEEVFASNSGNNLIDSNLDEDVDRYITE
jgi:hypothetical protein